MKRYIHSYLAVIVLVCTSWLAASCTRAPQPVELQPYESLLQILSDFALHQSDDLYRRGYPRDITGTNLFHAVRQRLDNYETVNPGRYHDIVSVSKGQISERLGDYEKAAAEYADLGPDSSEEMRAVAAQNLSRVNELAAIARRPMDSSNLERYLAELELKRNDLLELSRRFAGTPYEYLALIEAEQADVERVILLFNSRYLLPNGQSRAIGDAKEFIKRHESSHRILRHRLMLGDFYATMARDYIALNPPERHTFRFDEFNSLIAAAREEYFYVSRQDGAPEKIEARGKLQSVESLNNQIADLQHTLQQ